MDYPEPSPSPRPASAANPAPDSRARTDASPDAAGRRGTPADRGAHASPASPPAAQLAPAATPSPDLATGTRSFTTEVAIDAPRDLVWRALASAEEIRRWFAPEASLEPRVGGRLTWKWGDVHTWVCQVEAWQPGERLRLRYDSPVDDGHGGKKPLFVEFVLLGRGGVTTLRLVHSGFGPEADFAKEYDGISRGWPVELRSLKLYVERHSGHDRGLVWFAHPTSLTPERTWAVLTSSDGLVGGEGIDRLGEDGAFALRTREGDEFTGRALVCNPREFTGVAENLGGAWLRISVETFTGETVLWFWVATYGEDQTATARRKARLRAFLQRLFPTPAASEQG